MKNSLICSLGLIVLVSCGSSLAERSKTANKHSCNNLSCNLNYTRPMTDAGNAEIAVKPAKDIPNNSDLGTQNLAPTPNTKTYCPADMVYIEGNYCPALQATCLYYVDIHGNRIPEKKGMPGRCGEFKYPTKCLTAKIHKQLCIDKYEYPNMEGHIPQSWMSWYDVKRACEANGKRLCTKSEWSFAAEGPDMHPIGYGDGYHRNTSSCNMDNPVWSSAVFNCTPHRNEAGHMVAPNANAACRKQLDSLLVPSGSKPDCHSSWGVFDMEANIDEFVVNETGHPYKSSLAGGHVFGVRNNAFETTDAHSPEFFWYETGGRCCKDIDH